MIQQSPQAIPTTTALTARFPFIFGSQYYRAPTPEPACWEMDFRAMRDMGFNAVKYFVQWRWSHRSPERFYFDDLDRLMDMAAEHDLGVTLNLLLDMSPLWLFERHPDARQLDNSGHVVEPYVVGHRSIGGHPGPCYTHAGALADRQRFVAASVEHFRAHPAMQMWDVWNEPELCFPQRTPNLANMVCYCDSCRDGFHAWLRAKYGDLERVNDVWGRCYERWEQVELPRSTGAVIDFIDWREFHLDVMAAEAAWRLDLVGELDPAHGRYLHVVPNTWFSSVTCADDFAMAAHCEVFASTMNGGASPTQHTISAGRGKICYNVESHINFGSTDMHQQAVDSARLLREFLPQIGLGIKGFLFWQYRPEILGLESPAWGLVAPDGTPRPVTEATRSFWAALRPHAPKLREALPAPAEVGIWRSRKNEIFHFCTQGSVDAHNAAIDACVDALYWDNVPCRIISGEMLAAGELDGLKLLVMPSCYYLTQDEADQLDRWVRAGGTLLCEAHLAGYNGTIGRHSRRVPGCGLADAWGLHEVDSTAVQHLRVNDGAAMENDAIPEDVRKAMKAFGTGGGTHFPIQCNDGSIVWGAHRFAELAGDDIEVLGVFNGTVPCLVRTQVGAGTVYYCGTNLARAAAHDPAGLNSLLRQAVATAGVAPIISAQAAQPGTVHIDLLGDSYAVVISSHEHPQTLTVTGEGTWRGIFTGMCWSLQGTTTVEVPALCAELFVCE